MADSSKTEKATPKRRRDERKRGNVAKSQDVVAVATLTVSYAMLRLLAPSFVEQTARFIEYCLGEAILAEMSFPALLQELLRQSGILVALTVGLLALTIIVVSIAATFAQTGMLVSAEALKPKFSKINPLQGFKRLFSLRSVIETLKGILKIILLLWLVYNNLMDMLSVNHKYLYTDLAAGIEHIYDSILTMIFQIIIAFAVVAAADYLYQWWDYEQQLRMSKQEIKEEYKQTEGDPQIKGKIKERQQQMARSRMMQQVPQADVVIKNPTHFAVALRYHPDTDNAPIVLAMGQDELALRIIQVAEENQVAVVENVPLARALYANAELGREIPPEFYGAVAEILVYIFRLNNDTRLTK